MSSRRLRVLIRRSPAPVLGLIIAASSAEASLTQVSGLRPG